MQAVFREVLGAVVPVQALEVRQGGQVRRGGGRGEQRRTPRFQGVVQHAHAVQRLAPGAQRIEGSRFELQARRGQNFDDIRRVQDLQRPGLLQIQPLELERDPLFSRKMIASLSVRLHHLITDVESYSLHSGRQRIIGYLLRDNPKPDTRSLTVTLPTSKGTIASRLNLTQEHFSRILHELSEAGLIVVEGRKITIQDVEKLRGYDL